MSVLTTRPISTSDLAWLRVHTPENPSQTSMVMITDGKVDSAGLKSRIEDRLMAHPRFRQALETPHIPLARPRWREVDEFRLSDHFAERSLSATETLDGALAKFSTEPFADDRPLWQARLFRLPDSGSAVALRAHSALADSTAVPALALALADDRDDRRQSARPPIGFESLISTRQVLEQASRPSSATRMLCEVITSRADRDTPLRTRLSTEKVSTCSQPIGLKALRGPSPDLDNSLNQRLVLAVTSALRQALHRHDWPAEDARIRAIVPINLRREGDAAIGSRLALALLGLPVDAPTAEERLDRVGSAIERLCLAPDKIVVLSAEVARGLSMSEVEERSLRLLAQKATLSLGFLAGPARRLDLCGQSITALRWSPAIIGASALGIGVIGYADSIRFTVSCDSSLPIAADRLAADMAAALEAV